MDRIDGLAQVNLIVTDLQRATEFWHLLGWQSVPRHTNAAVITFPSGMNLVLHEPPFAQHWDPAYAGPTAGSTVIDLNLPSRHAVDESHARLCAARYAIICDQDGHRVGLKSPQDPSRSYSLQ